MTSGFLNTYIYKLSNKLKQPLTLVTCIREMPSFKSRRGHRPSQLFPQSLYPVTELIRLLTFTVPFSTKKQRGGGGLLQPHDKPCHTNYSGEIHLVLRSLLFWHLTQRQAVQFIMNCLPIEDGTDRLSRNIGS